MWLINTDTFELERWDNYEKGSYAILSHTWEDDEVSFQEFQDLESSRKKKGFDKIERTVLMARDRNLKFAWVDTCCIDKTSSAELSEAVNSMYKWYDDSAVCFVHLSDLYSKLDTQFKDCRWFTRGWTLQELIAPKDVKFYDVEWIYIGNKIDLMGEIEKITKVPRRVIQSFGHGNWFHQCLYKESIAYRMSWASSRETTRVEDTAYCLLGIFGINMPLLYGEGDKAFIRLQEEICKQTTDMSLFAWKAKSEPPSGGPAEEFRGLFANHPREFS
ncbi:HET-domain-containing protein, partial [Hypoxylon sp. EC38]